MNEIVKENRHRIDTACQLCFLALNRHQRAVDEFHQERLRIEQLPYVQDEKERQTNKAAEVLASKAEKEYSEIHTALETIQDAAGSMAQLLDIGEEFQNTLSTVKALGKALPVEQRGALIEPFRGQMQALSILRAAYESTGIDPEHYFYGMIFDTAARVEELDTLARQATIQPQGNLLAAVNFGSALEKFVEALGVVLSEKFRDIVDTSATLTDALRKATGLGVND